MSDMMTEFVSSARERAAVVLSEQDTARSAEELRKLEQEANVQSLQAIIAREFEPVLDVLRKLPEKDGKRFIVTARPGDQPNTTKGQYSVGVSYEPTKYVRLQYKDDDGDIWAPHVGMVLELDKGQLTGQVFNYAIMETPHHNRRIKTSSFDVMRHELGLGLGSFAADRLDEIQNAAVSALAPEKEKPARKWHWPDFFHG